MPNSITLQSSMKFMINANIQAVRGCWVVLRIVFGYDAFTGEVLARVSGGPDVHQ